MNIDFKKRQVSFLIQIAMLSIVLFGAHYYLLHHFANDINLFFPLWQVYLFQIVVTVFCIHLLITNMLLKMQIYLNFL